MAQSTLKEWQLAGTLEALEAVCLQIRELLSAAGLPWSREGFAVELLAREALGNAVRHGCGLDPAKAVHCRLRLGPRTIRLRVEDAGPGFDWQSVLARPADDEATHGRGLPIYASYAQRRFYNRRGNALLLVRNLQEPTMNAPQESPAGPAILRPGDLTASTVDQARAKIKALLQTGPSELLIDLEGVQMVDSTGIGLLIQAHNTLAKTGGRLAIRGASQDLKDLFKSMRLDKRFAIEE